MLVVAHRGAPHRAPENTLASFGVALEIGVDAIELDLHLSRDGHLVVIHDARLERTTNGEGLVHEHTLADLRRLDAGSWFGAEFAGEPIPTFEEVLNCIGNRTSLQVEIKGKEPGVVEAAVEALRAHKRLADSMITSFQLDRLPVARALAPEAAIGALVWGRTPDGTMLSPQQMVEATRQAQADVMLVWHEYLTEEVMAAGQAAGLPVGAAGGDATEADMRRLLALGTARMTSNYPDLLKRVVQAAG